MTRRRTHSKNIGSRRIEIAVFGFAYVRRVERQVLLDTHVAGSMAENLGAGDTGTGGRRCRMSRRNKPQNRSNIGGWRVSQFGHRLGESRGRYDSWLSHRTVGSYKQNPGEVVNELAALDWERTARRGHGGPTALTWTLLHVEYDPYIGVDCQILAGWHHPAST